MKKRYLLISMLILAFALASCGAASSNEQVAMDRGMVMEDFVESAPMAAPMEEAASGAYEAKGAPSSIQQERIVIKNADLQIIVTDPVDSMAVISKMADDKGGFVVSSNTYKFVSVSGKELPAGTITIRVPAETLEETLAEIKALVEDPDLDIVSESVSGQDVTSEVTDLESRLRNLEQAEQQLLEIMDDANETEDVMSVFRELTYIREEIELLEGQLKYYTESARLSAIYVNIQAKEAVAPISIGGWRPSLTIQRALQALVNGLKFLANTVIWLIIFVGPIALLIGLPVFLIVRSAKKKKAKKKESK